jgi:nucleoside-diphosphate-sugar epimerase
MSRPTILVAGASGLIGRAALEQFRLLDGWDVIGVSRQPPDDLPGVRALALDLTDEAACAEVLGGLGGVTHLVFAALQEGPGLLPGWRDEELIERNGAMLRHCVDPLLAGGSLRHVSLLQGTKAYGVHHPDIGPAGAPIPLRERAPRVEHRNFYWLQEDHLLARQAEAGFALTVFRPTVVYGTWGRHNERTPREAVDADLVARALVWAATSPAAHGGTFNLTNGDVFTWAAIWPAIADELGMAVGEHRPMSFAADLPGRDDEWAHLVAAHGLSVPPTVEGFVGQNSLVYADVVMAEQQGGPILNSTIAARRAGFADCIDTEDMFRSQLRRLVELGALPPRP